MILIVKSKVNNKIDGAIALNTVKGREITTTIQNKIYQDPSRSNMQAAKLSKQS